ncbi:tetratricopeptide repeat protein [uncultured Tateyamaria sp.]|uniref:tetratricopeptide repeat protein n=1 Tax=uncultured Tateyamaria sp. TaxID=455651 RepID=UPI00261B7547|nr:tetratricopeptide repeat protein [uncultured Tateyamaria sp.]
MKHLALVALLSGPAAAQTCPPVTDQTAVLDALRKQIREAPNQIAAEPFSSQMWEIWLDAPDEAAQEVLDLGLRQRNNGDYAGAIQSFGKLIKYCPDYAEGFNQRAFTSFLRADYATALQDLDAALRLLPDHVGAQSGRALTLMNMGRTAEARAQMLAALENNPWLSERALVSEGGPLGPRGEDI